MNSIRWLQFSYKRDMHNQFILRLNENLDPFTKTLVCAHELGHDILH